MRYRRSCRAVLAPRNPRFSRILGVSTALVVSVGLLGCGQENELGRLPFSGTVSLNGKPIERGSISFEPTGGDGIRSGATITDGKFTVEEMDGLPAGKYLVRINAGSGDAASSKDSLPGRTGMVQSELIPPEWNTNSEHEIEITGNGENRFNFEVQSG